MRVLTTTELARFRTTQDSAMMDLCVIQTFTEITDTFGQMIRTWTDGDPIAMGIDTRPGSENRTAEMTIVKEDATVRLPIDTTVTIRDRIKVIMRHGSAIEPIIYGILEEPRRGPSGITLRLERVDPLGESI